MAWRAAACLVKWLRQAQSGSTMAAERETTRPNLQTGYALSKMLDKWHLEHRLGRGNGRPSRFQLTRMLADSGSNGGSSKSGIGFVSFGAGSEPMWGLGGSEAAPLP